MTPGQPQQRGKPINGKHCNRLIAAESTLQILLQGVPVGRPGVGVAQQSAARRDCTGQADAKRDVVAKSGSGQLELGRNQLQYRRVILHRGGATLAI
jgi:hypothetical protein